MRITLLGRADPGLHAKVSSVICTPNDPDSRAACQRPACSPSGRAVSVSVRSGRWLSLHAHGALQLPAGRVLPDHACLADSDVTVRPRLRRSSGCCALRLWGRRRQGRVGPPRCDGPVACGARPRLAGGRRARRRQRLDIVPVVLWRAAPTRCRSRVIRRPVAASPGRALLFPTSLFPARTRWIARQRSLSAPAVSGIGCARPIFLQPVPPSCPQPPAPCRGTCGPGGIARVFGHLAAAGAGGPPCGIEEEGGK